MALAIGVIGCGTIGTEILSAVADGTIDATVGSLYDRNPEKVDAALAELDSSGDVRAAGPAEVARGVDLVVEAAGQSAVRDAAVDVLASGTDLLVLSVGALADDALRSDVLETAESQGATLHVPSGAIAGLDAVKAAAQAGGLDEVRLTTRKPPEALAGAPYVEGDDVALDELSAATTIFEGSAVEAASAFPSNINVAVALSLAGVGVEQTRVEIIADPDESNNVHSVHASGPAGTVETTVRNVPSPTNPKSSYLAPLSAIAKLRELTARARIGT